MARMTEQQFQHLQQKVAGKHRNSPVEGSAAPKSADLPVGRGKDPNRPTGAKTKARFRAQIQLFCVVYKMHLLQEQRFDRERQWRFDFVVVGRGRAVPIEYEGIFNGDSRHTHAGTYTEDVEKYNAATLAGIPPLRYTAVNHQRVFRDLEKMFKINC